MRCPRCGHVDDKVIDSRQSREGDLIRRRRECLECGVRFTTYERLEIALPMVVKRDGRREGFSREKLLAGVRRACEKRPVGHDALTALAERVEAELMERGDPEVSAQEVGDRVMAQLQQLDQVAWLRFASVYRSFQDIGEFLAAADRLRQAQTSEGS